MKNRLAKEDDSKGLFYSPTNPYSLQVQLLPSSGQGAVIAMQDAAVLANYLYDLKSPSSSDIHEALQDFKDQRYSHVREQYDASKMNAKIVYGQMWFERTMRHVVFNFMPKSMQMKNVSKGTANRPQAVFLSFIPHRGACRVLLQKLSARYQGEHEQA